MSATLVAFREKRWLDQRTEHAMWSHLARAYGADLQLLENLSEMDCDPNAQIIVVDEEGSVVLSDYEHPENAVYVFGRSQQRLLPLFDDVDSVRIDTPNPISLFGVVAAGIVMDARGL